MSDFMTAEDALLLANQYTDEHGGGGGGTTNYNSLSNRPQINGTTLSGNKTGHQLGLQNELTFDNVPTQNSNNPVKSGGVYSALAEKVTAEAGKVLSSNDYTTAEKTKLAGIEADAEVNVIEKIVLNGVELVPANKEVAINVITRAVNNLTNYYLKSETYTKTEVDDLLSAMASLTLEIVETLPTTSISTTTIYLVPVAGQTNVYMQYAYINNDWAQLGTTQVDLTNYYTKTQVDALLDGKEDTLTFDSAPTASSTNPVTSGGVYDALSGKQDTLTFDNAPTENSNNPVKSGGVYTALSGKQDTLTFDNEPTLGSHNMVDSDAVAQALDDVSVPIATEQDAGIVKPDGTTITIDNDGTIHGSSGIQPDEADFTFDQGLLSLNADRRYFTGTQAEWDELNSADKALYSVVNITDDDGTATPLQLDDYQKKDLTAQTEGATTVEGALTNLSTNKQPKTLASPITIGGESKTTVETALSALNGLVPDDATSSNKLVSKDKAMTITYLSGSVDFNDLTETGLYIAKANDVTSVSHAPSSITLNGGFTVEVQNHGTESTGANHYCTQIFNDYMPNSSPQIRRNYYQGGEMWGDWLSLTTSKSESYSTTETLTNKVWIDGKPIYRRVFSYQSTIGAGATETLGTINDLSRVISIGGTMTSTSGGTQYTIPYGDNQSHARVYCDISTSGGTSIGTLKVNCIGSGFKGMFIVLEYTKSS